MNGPRVVVITGAGGFIARHLHDRLLAEGVEVRGVDLVGVPERGILAGTTADLSTWAHLLEGADAVVHTAATVSNVMPLDHMWEINVLATDGVLLVHETRSPPIA